jgi:hypothetical protein
MSVEVHRANRTFYAHQTVLLNQPGRELSALMAVEKWQGLTAASFLSLSQVAGRKLPELAGSSASSAPPIVGITEDDRNAFRKQGLSEEQIAAFEAMQATMSARRSEQQGPSGAKLIADSLVRDSGVAWDVWERAGYEMMEAVMPLQTGTPQSLMVEGNAALQEARRAARGLGFVAVDLATDFPITTATYGYSRTDYQPNAARLNAFPADKDHGGRFPIFVDVVQADAILIRLDHNAVSRWLTANGSTAVVPGGANAEVASRAAFVRLLDRVQLRSTIAERQARLVFGLLHTLSHVAMRRASLLCGLEGTSLSEYILPRALTFALYCNHRFGATIGALTALFEQSLREWFGEVLAARRCVYDPVCLEHGGSCHACTHVAETSCRFFNLNLGRPFLFGGPDEVLGRVTGFLDFVADEQQ